MIQFRKNLLIFVLNNIIKIKEKNDNKQGYSF
jgi:hypothetical protein